MGKNKSFRHCHGEKVMVYATRGKTTLEGLSALIKGLKKIESEQTYPLNVGAISVNYIEDFSSDDYYEVIAYVYGV